MPSPGSTRRRFIGGLAAASIGVPTPLHAQPKTVKVGMVSPVTGPMADVGQDSRLGAQLAVEAVNAAVGIKSLGGARIELLTADSETKPEVARSEADRLINAGAQIMTGAFHSAHVATVALLAQQRRVPYIIDISAADAPTANAAKSVREGQQKIQYVYRIFPGSATFGRNAVRYMAEIFREAGVSPKRTVLMYSNDLFGKTQTDSFQAAVRAANPGFEVVDVIPYPENAVDLSTDAAQRGCEVLDLTPSPENAGALATEVSRAGAARPDVLAPITRPATAILLLEELARQRTDLMGIISPGAPGLYETTQIQVLRDKIEYVMDCTVYANYRKPEVRKIAAEYEKRSGGRHFDASGAYSY